MHNFFLKKNYSRFLPISFEHLFLLLISVVFIVLRFPSLFEPHWYGDEGIYQVVGRALNSGSVLYRDVWDNKPPLLYLLYAATFGNLFYIKGLSLLVGLASVVSFFFLSKKLFQQNLAIYISSLIFVFYFSTPILEGNIANAENFMLLPIICAAYFIVDVNAKNQKKHLIVAGLLMSLAFAIKIVAIFDVLAFMVFMLCLNGPKVKRIVVGYFYFLISFSVLSLIFLIYFAIQGALPNFISAVFLNNVGYVGDQNSLVVPMGMLAIKTLILCAVVGGIVYTRARISKASLFIYLWTVFALYSAFFSDRPYIHYLLVLLPALSLLVGNVFASGRMRFLNVLLLLLICQVVMGHFDLYKKNIAYYHNFIDFMIHGKSVTDYQSFFDASTPVVYELASFIKANSREDDTVFLWSDSPQIYVLAEKLPIGKYVVAYHITFHKDAGRIMREQIERKQPKFIIQTVETPMIEGVLSSYQLRYIMDRVKIYEKQI